MTGSKRQRFEGPVVPVISYSDLLKQRTQYKQTLQELNDARKTVSPSPYPEVKPFCQYSHAMSMTCFCYQRTTSHDDNCIVYCAPEFPEGLRSAIETDTQIPVEGRRRVKNTLRKPWCISYHGDLPLCLASR